MVETLLASLQQCFGFAGAFVFADDTPWVFEWNRWERFAEEVQVHGAELNDVLMTELRDLFFAMGRIAADNVAVPERTNMQAIAELRLSQGLVCGQGEVWGANQCLADSLLQLLVHHRLGPADVDREGLCTLNRNELESD